MINEIVPKNIFVRKIQMFFVLYLKYTHIIHFINPHYDYIQLPFPTVNE
jgi:hypothetical protein